MQVVSYCLCLHYAMCFIDVLRNGVLLQVFRVSSLVCEISAVYYDRHMFLFFLNSFIPELK